MVCKEICFILAGRTLTKHHLEKAKPVSFYVGLMIAWMATYDLQLMRSFCPRFGILSGSPSLKHLLINFCFFWTALLLVHRARANDGHREDWRHDCG